MEPQDKEGGSFVKELCPETFIFPLCFAAFLALFVSQMGLANAINTIMNTAYRLLIDTVLYITAVCVMMGAVSSLLSEFGFVSLANRLLQPLMKPVFNMPGAAALGVVTTFLSDNPAILTLTEDNRFRRYFRKYQFPALTNLGTAFGMGLIVCTYMYSLSPSMGTSLGKAVATGLAGALIGSVVSTRLMLRFTRAYYGEHADDHELAEGESPVPENMRPIRNGGIGSRMMAAVLDGGKSGVKMGISIIPGVLVICTIVMMLILLWASAILSAILDNIPFVATLIPLIIAMGKQGMDITPLWWAISLGACLGGNGTQIGASANVVLCGIAGKNGYPISFNEYTKVGFPMMILTVFIAMIFLLVRFAIL